ncbi:MAG TPA: hypothetical protein VLN72_07865 [Gillisia sp.]|nr:hypothetical protein [Gillisia sp.]
MKAFFKLFAVGLFLIASLFYNIRFSYLVVFYAVNNQSFTELYCENKDKPELECNGQCEITKAYAQTNSEANPMALENFQRDITFFYQISAVNELIIPEVDFVPFFSYLNQYSFLFSSPIPHPPAGIA